MRKFTPRVVADAPRKKLLKPKWSTAPLPFQRIYRRKNRVMGKRVMGAGSGGIECGGWRALVRKFTPRVVADPATGKLFRQKL